MLIASKSTENNADIFAAFSLIAQIEAGLGDRTAASHWTSEAVIAANFVTAMFDATNGRFNVGTVSSNANYRQRLSGRIPIGQRHTQYQISSTRQLPDTGPGRINRVWGLNSKSHKLATAPRLQCEPFYSLATFHTDVTADRLIFAGFDLVPAPPVTGVAWEFTGQVVERATIWICS